jgi:hypothetical protein
MSAATVRRPAAELTSRMTMGCHCLCLICAGGLHCHNFSAGCGAGWRSRNNERAEAQR